MSNFISQYNFSSSNTKGNYREQNPKSNQFGTYLINNISKNTDATILSNVNNLGLDKAGPTSSLKSIELNAVNQSYVQLNGMTTPKDSGISISTWVLCYRNSTWARIFDFGNGPGKNNIIMFLTGNSIGLCVIDNSDTRQYNVVPNVTAGSGGEYADRWFHIVWTLNTNREWKIYLDGVLFKTFTNMNYPLSVSRKNMYIGKSNWNDPYFNGCIADFRIYYSVLTPSDISSIYVPHERPPTPVFDKDIKWNWSWELSKNNFISLQNGTKIVSKFFDLEIRDNTNMSISFYINISSLNNNWRSILHISNDGGNCCAPGQRIPGIWIWPNQSALHFVFSTIANGNFPINTDAIPLKKDTYVSITISKNEINIYFNGVLNRNVKANAPLIRAIPTATVYSADPFYASDQFKIRDLNFANGNIYKVNDTTTVYNNTTKGSWTFSESDGKWYTLIKGGYFDTWSSLGISSFSNSSISFMINISKVPTEWLSIYHVSNDGENWGPERRIPGIWLSPNENKIVIGISTTANNYQEALFSNMILPINQDIKIDIMFFKRKCIIMINNNLDLDFTLNGDVIEPIPSAIVYIPDPFHNMTSVVKIKDFKVMEGTPSLYPPDLIGEFKKIGCYKDTTSRAIPTSRGIVKTLQECADIALRNNESVFGVQSGGQCYTGKSNSKSVKYGLLPDSNCYLNGTNLGGDFAQFVYQRPDDADPNYRLSTLELDCYKKRYPDLSALDNQKLQQHWTNTGANQNRDNQCPTVQSISGLYEYKGAFNDQANKAIPNLRNPGKKVTSVDECMSIAESNQDTVFGLQNGGDCYSGNNESMAYQYGNVYDKTRVQQLGGDMTNMVYVRKEAFPEPEPPVPELKSPNFSNNPIESFGNNLNNITDESSDLFKYNNDIMLFSEKVSGFLLLILVIIIVIIIYMMNMKK